MKFGYLAALAGLLTFGCGDSEGLQPIKTYRNGSIISQKIDDTLFTAISGVPEESVLRLYPEKTEDDKKTKDLLEKANKARISLGKSPEEFPVFDGCDVVAIDYISTPGVDRIEVVYGGKDGNVWMTKKFSLESANRTGSTETYSKRTEALMGIIGQLPDAGWDEEDSFEFERFGIDDPRKRPVVKTYRSGDVLLQNIDGVIFVAVEDSGKYLTGIEREREHKYFDAIFLLGEDDVWRISLIYKEDTPIYGRPSRKESIDNGSKVLRNFQENFEADVGRMQVAVGIAKLEEVRGSASGEAKHPDERFEKLFGVYKSHKEQEAK